jgi:hypothetical protein
LTPNFEVWKKIKVNFIELGYFKILFYFALETFFGTQKTAKTKISAI